jgi:hypothetical protein
VAVKRLKTRRVHSQAPFNEDYDGARWLMAEDQGMRLTPALSRERRGIMLSAPGKALRAFINNAGTLRPQHDGESHGRWPRRHSDGLEIRERELRACLALYGGKHSE